MVLAALLVETGSPRCVRRLIMSLLDQKLSQVKCALMVPLVIAAVVAVASLLTYSILDVVEASWRYPLVLIGFGCIVGLVLLIWLFPFLGGLAAVGATGFMIGRSTTLPTAIMAAAVIWWLPANLGISWSRPWAARWERQDQVFLLRAWQVQIRLLAHAIAYSCPIALVFCLLYLLYRRWA
jgi:hypothetical protein